MRKFIELVRFHTLPVLALSDFDFDNLGVDGANNGK